MHLQTKLHITHAHLCLLQKFNMIVMYFCFIQLSTCTSIEKKKNDKKDEEECGVGLIEKTKRRDLQVERFKVLVDMGGRT